ncbi:hypothetical protein Ciccas_006938 [Cichlidogyrus casuarinus]|uniref:Uncharacterized protein n=1 Tax=Cichlidogyrus casuarinus TaxID=1844966 RepID=A0ABD2Q6U4_9PLAT
MEKIDDSHLFGIYHSFLWWIEKVNQFADRENASTQRWQKIQSIFTLSASKLFKQTYSKLMLKINQFCELHFLLDPILIKWPRLQWLVPHGYIPKHRLTQKVLVTQGGEIGINPVLMARRKNETGPQGDCAAQRPNSFHALTSISGSSEDSDNSSHIRFVTPDET